MKGLGAGDGGGLPTLTPRGMTAAAAPSAPESNAALKDETAASAAARAAGAAAPGASANTDEEDYKYTYLAPAVHKYGFPTDRTPDAPHDWRYLMQLGLEGSAGLAAIYLFFHSDLGYLVGMARRRKKTGGES